jgi:hypothetical protein
VCEKNQTFLIPSGPDKHLYVVITESDDSGMYVLANITSIDPAISHDKSCCVASGEHPFVKHDSYVAYEFAMVRHGALVDKQVQLGVYIQKENASDALVEKMRAGLKKSPFAKRGLKDDYDKAVRAEEKRKKAAQQAAP